jgi:hypothetical protein
MLNLSVGNNEQAWSLVKGIFQSVMLTLPPQRALFRCGRCNLRLRGGAGMAAHANRCNTDRGESPPNINISMGPDATASIFMRKTWNSC